MTGLRRLGHSITRNKKYSGYGGINGRANIQGKKFLIQAKRYAAYITARDVEKYAAFCKQTKCTACLTIAEKQENGQNNGKLTALILSVVIDC